MKIILFIFCFYLLVLPVVACAETDSCANEIQSSITKTDNHADHEKEGCGAFCTCSCCLHIVSVNFQSQVISIDKPVIESTRLSFYHNISLPSNHFGNIWQPPKMG